MNKLLMKIAVFGILIGVLILQVGPAVSGPLIGVQGSRVQAYFMSQDPDPADAGRDLDLRWQVFNTIPGTINSLKFHLDAGYPFLFEAGNSPDIDLGPSAGTNDNQVFYILHYKLRVADNAIKGTYNVTLNWDTGTGWTKKDYEIYIDPKRADFVVGALVTSPEKLIADAKEAKLSVNIDNIGKGNAENVKVKLLLPDGFKPTFSYSDEDSLGIITKGGTAAANFYVDIEENINEGEHIGKIEITYRDENDADNAYRTKTLDLLLPIKPAPYLIVETATTSPENLAAGDKAELRIKVKNSGNEKAESVSLRVFKDASQPFDFSEKSDFIGKLEPQASGDAVLKMTIDTKAVSKKYLLDVELRGIDEKNNVVIFRRTIPISIEQKARGVPGIGTVGMLISIGAAAGLFYLRRRN